MGIERFDAHNCYAQVKILPGRGKGAPLNMFLFYSLLLKRGQSFKCTVSVSVKILTLKSLSTSERFHGPIKFSGLWGRSFLEAGSTVH